MTTSRADETRVTPSGEIRCDQCGGGADPEWARNVPDYYDPEMEISCLSCWYMLKRGHRVGIDSDIIRHTASAVEADPHKLVTWLVGEDSLGHELELDLAQEAIVAELHMRQQLRTVARDSE